MVTVAGTIVSRGVGGQAIVYCFSEGNNASENAEHRLGKSKFSLLDDVVEQCWGPPMFSTCNGIEVQALDRIKMFHEFLQA